MNINKLGDSNDTNDTNDKNIKLNNSTDIIETLNTTIKTIKTIKIINTKYDSKLIVHKFYKNLVNDELDNIINLRNIQNYNKALKISEKLIYVKNINELVEGNSIRYLSAKNLCNIGFKTKHIFKEIIDNKFIILSNNNKINKVLLNDKVVIFKQ
jgi:hypothetical protein